MFLRANIKHANGQYNFLNIIAVVENVTQLLGKKQAKALTA